MTYYRSADTTPGTLPGTSWHKLAQNWQAMDEYADFSFCQVKCVGDFSVQNIIMRSVQCLGESY